MMITIKYANITYFKSYLNNLIEKIDLTLNLEIRNFYSMKNSKHLQE